MMRAAPLLALALVGCCGEAPPPSIICPQMRDYPAAEQQALGAELAGDGPITRRWLRDYVALRAQIRACMSPEGGNS